MNLGLRFIVSPPFSKITLNLFTQILVIVILFADVSNYDSVGGNTRAFGSSQEDVVDTRDSMVLNLLRPQVKGDLARLELKHIEVCLDLISINTMFNN